VQDAAARPSDLDRASPMSLDLKQIVFDGCRAHRCPRDTRPGNPAQPASDQAQSCENAAKPIAIRRRPRCASRRQSRFIPFSHCLHRTNKLLPFISQEAGQRSRYRAYAKKWPTDQWANKIGGEWQQIRQINILRNFGGLRNFGDPWRFRRT
jgi:hypothetical protein